MSEALWHPARILNRMLRLRAGPSDSLGHPSEGRGLSPPLPNPSDLLLPQHNHERKRSLPSRTRATDVDPVCTLAETLCLPVELPRADIPVVADAAAARICWCDQNRHDLCQIRRYRGGTVDANHGDCTRAIENGSRNVGVLPLERDRAVDLGHQVLLVRLDQSDELRMDCVQSSC